MLCDSRLLLSKISEVQVRLQKQINDIFITFLVFLSLLNLALYLCVCVVIVAK